MLDPRRHAVLIVMFFIVRAVNMHQSYVHEVCIIVAKITGAILVLGFGMDARAVKVPRATLVICMSVFFRPQTWEPNLTQPVAYKDRVKANANKQKMPTNYLNDPPRSIINRPSPLKTNMLRSSGKKKAWADESRWNLWSHSPPVENFGSLTVKLLLPSGC